ncbi:MAG: 8-amino-7-oxononanoate synthase, partial [Candidatus Omnitrophota bacterium]
MKESFLKDDLENLEAQNLRRSLKEVASSQAKEIILNGKRVLNFCSNNYLGLADDERIGQAAIKAIAQDGFGSGASRLVCGTMKEHLRLEEKLARLKETEAALVFSSGYMANVGIISALVDREDVVLSDKLNHASIIDGIILSRAQLKRYAHNDMQSLEEALKASGGFKKRLIVTDTVFSMDGDTAPLKDIVQLAHQYDAWVMVDEAHAFGVFGEHGGGLVEREGLGGHVDIQMGTLSKAAGCFGAYVAGSKDLCEYLINHSRSFIYTTALPPSCAAAASQAVDIIA